MSPDPIIVAHRGLHHEYPENSLGAFRAAWDAGVEWCECDVQYSLDGEPFVLHDQTLERTTTGVGYAHSLDGDELSKVHLRNSQGDIADERLPRLGQALIAIPEGCGLLVEIKGWLPDPWKRALGAMLYGHVVMLQSFHPECLTIMRAFGGKPQAAVLIESPDRLATALEDWIPAIHLEHSLLTAEYLAASRAAGKRVGVWTPNTEHDLRRALNLGIDMIITDEPLLARQLIAERK